MADFPPHIWVTTDEGLNLIVETTECHPRKAIRELYAAKRDHQITTSVIDGMGRMYQRQSVLDWLNIKDRHSGRATIRKGGRPTERQSVEISAEITRIVHDDGVPQKQAELVQKVLQFCQNTFGDEPSETAVKDRIRAVYQALGKGKN